MLRNGRGEFRFRPKIRLIQSRAGVARRQRQAHKRPRRGAIFDNGRYYIFGEHKLGGTLGNKSVVGVHCYSSDDLYNWKDEGIALEMSGDPDSEIVRGTILERPKVIYNPRTKKYVMWMHLEFRKGPTAKSADL